MSRPALLALPLALLLGLTAARAQTHAPAGTVPAGHGAPAPEAPPAGTEAGAQDHPSAATPPAATPAPAQGPQEGQAHWLRTPAPETTVRLRLRGPALSAVLDPAQQWELVAIDAAGAASPVPAELELPAAPPAPQPQTLAILKRSDAAAHDAWVIVDRGPSAPALSRLRIQLADAAYAQPVRLEAGNSLDNFTPLSQPQLLYQELRAGDTVTFDTVECPAGRQRFLRLTLPGGGALKIDAVSGWDEPPPGELYTVSAALGPMHRDALTGNSIWPLILPGQLLPLAQVKVSAVPEDDGEARNMRVVRLSPDSAVLSSGPSQAWGQRLHGGGTTRDERWLDIAPEVQSEPYGISVADGKQPPLQLSAVQAYAGEVCLTCSMPAAGELRLRIHPQAEAGAPQPPAPAPATPAPAAVSRVIDGEFSGLQPLTAAAPAAKPQPRATGGNAPVKLPFALPAWTAAAVFSLAGVLTLLWGLSLLRRAR